MKFLVGIVLGFVIATVGFGNFVATVDNKINEGKRYLEDNFDK